MQDFKHFDPKQAAMDEARGLLEAAARAAMADGSLPGKGAARLCGGGAERREERRPGFQLRHGGRARIRYAPA